jgi:tellurite methyltransferase
LLSCCVDDFGGETFSNSASCLLQRILPRNWDEHYSAPANLNLEPTPLLVQVADMLPPGRALDLACGAGRNALYLAKLGWQVTAVDSSEAAIRHLRRLGQSSTLDARVADLEKHEFAIEPGSYDLICDFFYLQTDLFTWIRRGVRNGGVFTGAIHLVKPGHNPAFALHPGDLRKEFDGWKILYYSEAAEPGHTRPSARIIARRA